MIPTSTKIWIDCDPGHDDMLAIILATFNKKIKLLGISTVIGNSTLEKTTENALKTLEFCNIAKIPVIKGSAEPYLRSKDHIAKSFGYLELDSANLPPPVQSPLNENLYHYLNDIILNTPEQVTLVATGPCTNYAILFKSYPEVKKRIKQIVLMGGAINYGNITPAAEFNIWCDPEAAKVIFGSSVPIVVIPSDVTVKLLYTAKEIKPKILVKESPFLQTLVKLLDFCEEKARKEYLTDGSAIHDPATIAWIIDSSIFKMKGALIGVETCSTLCDGRTVVDFNGPPNANIALECDVDAFWKMMIGAILEANENVKSQKITANE